MIARDGVFPVLAMLGAGFLAAFCAISVSPWFWVLAAPVLLLGVFLAWFFRDPERRIPGGVDDLVSPADGRILVARSGVAEERYLNQETTQISIFMSPADVHVNRNPIDGDVAAVHYHPGRYFAAFSEKASLDNEQNAVVVDLRDDRRLVFVQIAGFLARRIVCNLEAGDSCARGERMGMIKLGSRVDIFVPGAFRLDVKSGDRVRAGETILGRLG